MRQLRGEHHPPLCVADVGDQVRGHPPRQRRLAAQHAAQGLGQPLRGLVLGQVADGAGPHRRDHVGRIARLAQHHDADALAVELE